MTKAVKPKPIGSNFSWSLCGNVVYAICQWGILVVLAKVGTVASVGEFSLGLAITAPVVLFFNLQLRNVVATDSKFDHHFTDYLRIRVLSSISAMLLMLGILLLLPYAGVLQKVILMIGVAKIIESISDLCFGLFQQHERLDYVARSMIIKGLLGLISIYTGLALADSLLLGTMLMSLSWVLVLFLYDFRVVARITDFSFSFLLTRCDWKPIKRIVWLALPLGLVEMLASANINAPRYFVEHFNGIEMLGIYSGMAYFMVAGVTVVYACGQSFLPRMAKMYAENEISSFKALFCKFGLLVLSVGVAGVGITYFFGGPVLELFYSSAYKSYGDVFSLIMLAAAISYLATSVWFGLTSMRCFRSQVVLFGVALGCNIGLCALLLPPWGLKGAAVAFAVSEVVRLLIGLVIMLQQLRKKRLLLPEAMA